MAKYKAFISYRKSHAEYAELVKTSLIEQYGYAANEIFLDKHDIGPEYFDSKLKAAVVNSSSIILIVTKDCFVPKENGEDWFLEEIKTALNNNITIIPILFDEIKSLDVREIRSELEKTFKKEEIERLIKTQSIRYDFDLSDSTFLKLSKFIEKADKPTALIRLSRMIKSVILILAVLAFAFALFIGIGFLWGYFSSGTDKKDILLDNTHIDGNSAFFEFGGLEAEYDLLRDTIIIDLDNYEGKIPESNFEILAHSCSVSGAILLFDNNIKSLKYLKYLKNGSKPGKYVMLGVTVAACLGSFCGFSQGSKWGRTLNQQNKALALFPELKNKDFWRPVFSGSNLNFKYTQSRTQKILQNSFLRKKQIVADSINTLTWCTAVDSIPIAKKAGLKGYNIVCKFNNWEIGRNTPRELSNEIVKSKNLKKILIVLEVDSIRSEIKKYSLPEGIAGIGFSYPIDTTDIASVVNMYNSWKRKIDD